MPPERAFPPPNSPMNACKSTPNAPQLLTNAPPNAPWPPNSYIVFSGGDGDDGDGDEEDAGVGDVGHDDDHAGVAGHGAHDAK